MIQRYFETTKNEKLSKTLSPHEKATHFAIKSLYFYQIGQYDKAEDCAGRCLNNAKILLEDEAQCNDGWFLVRKSLNNIKPSGKARMLLEQLLLTTIK